MNDLSLLPSNVRFYHDLDHVRKRHLSTAPGVAYPWVEFDGNQRSLSFRGANLATSNYLAYDADYPRLRLTLRLLQGGELLVLPQDATTQDEIIAGATAFHGDDAQHQVEADPGLYEVVAHPEDLPFIANFYIVDGFKDQARNTRNATLLTPEECDAIIAYTASQVPTS